MKKLITAAVATVLLAGCSSAATTNEEALNNPVDTTIEGGSMLENTAMEITRRENEVDPHEVLGTYDGHTILAMDFITPMMQERSSQEEMLRMFGLTDEDIADYWVEENDGETTMDLFRAYVLNRVKEQATILVLAERAGFSYDPEELDKINDELRIMMDTFIEQGMNPYQMFYDNNGISIEDFSRVQKNSLTIFGFVQDMMASIDVSDEDVATYLEENAATLEASRQVTAGHILLNLENWEEAEAEVFANELADRLRAGEDINELAKEYSEDPGVMRPEGAFYTFGRGQMVPEFESFAFDSEVGAIGVVRSDFGFHVMLVESQEDVTEKAIQNIRLERAEEQMNDLIEEANIEWDINEDVLDSIR